MHGMIFPRFLVASMVWILSWLISASACLTFCFQQKDAVYYGRNFDWNVGIGALMVNQRGVQKTAFALPPEKPFQWKSTYGSVTFNQFSKEIPVGGMNEKGLVIESLVSVAQPSAQDERPAINELQWIQYHLDTCSSVEEVLASASRIRVWQYAVSLHYFISDASGASAVVEFLNGKLVRYSGDQLPTPVLANTRYDHALEMRKTSTGRFGRAAGLLEAYQGTADPTTHAFQVLDAVAQGDFTKWQVVYDLSNLRITFRSRAHSEVRWISFADLDFSPNASSRMLDVNQAAKGDLKTVFQPYTVKANDSLMRRSLTALQKDGVATHLTPAHLAVIRSLVAGEQPQ